MVETYTVTMILCYSTTKMKTKGLEGHNPTESKGVLLISIFVLYFYSSFHIATTISIVSTRVTSLGLVGGKYTSYSAYESTQSFGKNAVLWDVIKIVVSGAHVSKKKRTYSCTVNRGWRLLSQNSLEAGLYG